MESIPLEMDDIFGDDDDEAGDFSPSRLPDLEDELEPMRNLRNDSDDDAGKNQEEVDNAEILAKLKSMKGASKNIARKTLPKLDAARLTGERGIPILPKFFENVPLKGKNHEVEDLKIIMQKLEHWAHRLFPKMPFAEVLERAERLGAKKDVQTCVKRIRLDMPVLLSDQIQDEENIEQGTEEKDTDSVHRNEVNSKDSEIDDEELEELLKEQQLPLSELNRTEEIHPNVLPHSKPKNDITDDIKARIERNKQMALQKRAAKLSKATQGDNQSLMIDTEQPYSVMSNADAEDKSITSTSTTVSRSEDVTVSKTLNGDIVSGTFLCETDVELTECDGSATAMLTDRLFAEDSDSEMLNLADGDSQ